MYILNDVTNAVQKVAKACSYQLGKDCIWHAMAAKYLLKKCEIKSRIVIGFSAWRVGDSDGAVITHVPIKGVKYQPNEFPFHAWLEINDVYIFDVTTYLFEAKMKALDSIDGNSTEVSWCPDYLYIHKNYSKPLSEVIQRTPCLSYYEENEFVTKHISNVVSFEEDINKEDAAILEQVFQNPWVTLVGPNTIKGEINHG